MKRSASIQAINQPEMAVRAWPRSRGKRPDMANYERDSSIVTPQRWFLRMRRNLGAVRDLQIRSTFVKNWLALSFSDLFGQVLSFFAMFRVARHLTPAGYGSYALILATASLFSLIAGMGLSLVNVTEVAKNHSASRQVLRLTLQIRTVSTVVSIALMMGYYVLVKHEQDQFIIAITAITIVNSGLVDIFENLAFGRQVMRFTSLLNMANSLLWVVGLFLIPLSYLTVQVVILYYVFLQVLRTVVYCLIEAKQGFFRKAAEVPDLNRSYLLKEGLPYYWMALVGTSTVQMPVILLGLLAGTAQVGLFNAGNRLVAAIRDRLQRHVPLDPAAVRQNAQAISRGDGAIPGHYVIGHAVCRRMCGTAGRRN